MVKCDPELKHFLCHVNEKLTVGPQLIVQVLEDTQLFVSLDLLYQLKGQIEVGMVEGRGKVWDRGCGLQ
jgi:hypothetical protein